MRNILPVGVILIGIGCLIYGVGLILPAAAWIVGGFFGLVLGRELGHRLEREVAGGDAAEGGDSPSPGAAAPPSPAGGGRESPVRAVRGGTDVGGDCG